VSPTSPATPVTDGRLRARRRPPAALLVPAVVAIALFALPLIGLLGRAPWPRLGTLLSGPTVTDALRLSLLTSVLATAASLLLGVPLAWLLSRVAFPGKRLVRALVTLPMVLPPVVGGTALLLTLGRRGLLGGPLADATGLVLPFSLAGVVVANTFVALPFLVVTVEGALDSLDRRHEAAAATLGAGPLTVFRRVTLPMIAPSLRAGMVLAWARALGEFGATVTFAGNLQGRTQTLPLAVFVALESDRDAAVAISLVLVAVSLVVLTTLRDRWWSRTS
jgi:molybdate transport system permease protein